MNPEVHKDLLQEAQQLAYQYLLHSGVLESFTQNEQGDALAAQIGEKIVKLMADEVEAVSLAA